MLSRSIARSTSAAAAARCSCVPATSASASTSTAICSRYSSSHAPVSAPSAYSASSTSAVSLRHRSQESATSLVSPRRHSRRAFATKSHASEAGQTEEVDFTPSAARSPESIEQWLRQAFPAFRLPANVAAQMITHESWGGGKHIDGHNRRLSFLGRRALKLYMALFLHSCATSTPEAAQAAELLLADQERFDELLHTSRLGDKVGRELRLEQVMRWVPAGKAGEQVSAREMGLFKIRGVCVEALVGAVYHQHGAATARSFFQARILPSLLRDTFPDVTRGPLLALADAAQDEGEQVLLALEAEQDGGRDPTEARSVSSGSPSESGSNTSSLPRPTSAVAASAPARSATTIAAPPFSASSNASHRPRSPQELRDAARADIALAAVEGRPVSNEQRAVASG